MQLTNSREVAGFVVARAIIVVLVLGGSPYVLAPLYVLLYEADSAILVAFASLSVSFLGWLATLVLFLVLRGAFLGVPAMVAGRRDAVTSSAGEIAAFLLAVVIVMIALTTFTHLVLPELYAPLFDMSRVALTMAKSVAVTVVFSVVFFLLFIAMRRAVSS